MQDANSGLIELLDALCNGNLPAEKQQRLEQLLRADANSRELYLDYIDMHLKIVEQAEQGRFSDLPAPNTWEIADCIDLVNANENGLRSIAPFVEDGHRYSRYVKYFIAAGLACLVSYLTLSSYFARDRAPNNATIAESAESNSPSGTTPTLTKGLYLAQIAAMSDDVAWGKDTDHHEFLLRLRRDDRLELDSGLVQVNYFSGASLILRGPCSFVLTGSDSGRLNHGELTGKVTNGDFLLTTPTAKVIDLGTEFGVSVDEVQNTDVQVFDGKVKVVAEHTNSDRLAASQLLTEGMTIRAVRGGQFASLEGLERQYTRVLPRAGSLAAPEYFSLVDALSCDEYGRYRLASAIAPDTGDAYEQSKLETEQAYPRQRHGTYHTTRWHPLVDGVFIPTNQGLAVQSDSTGRTIDLVANGANTSGPIWSRRRIEDTSRVIFHENFWGRRTRKRVLERLKASEQGMIGIHANVGLTFDLNAIREHSGLEFAGFRTEVSNLDNSDDWHPSETHEKRFIADFRVFVDGELRGSRLAFGRTDGDMTIEIPVSPEDRFLTFVSTDAGHYWYDQVVMIDPVLILAPSPQTALRGMPSVLSLR